MDIEIPRFGHATSVKLRPAKPLDFTAQSDCAETKSKGVCLRSTPTHRSPSLSDRLADHTVYCILHPTPSNRIQKYLTATEPRHRQHVVVRVQEECMLPRGGNLTLWLHANATL